MAMAGSRIADDWRLCAGWLADCGILSKDHKVTSESAQVFDLAQVLRDGVLICHLLNRLHPGSIDPKDFSQRPQMSQFLCLKNIRIFLQTCKNDFGLEDKDLFEPYDLFEVKDFGKVIKTLSKVSQSHFAKQSGVPGYNGFSANQQDYYNLLPGMAVPFNTRRSEGDEDKIYEQLPNIANSNPLEEDLYSVAIPDEEEEEIIYDDLTRFRQGSSRPTSQREYCIRELVETENNYMEALSMIVKFFTQPLKTVLENPDHELIFFGIEELLKIHQGFHSDLNKACSSRTSSVSTSSITIADCFVRWKERFLIYGQFCSNLPKAQNLVDELCNKSQAIQVKIVDCSKKANNGKFRLRDLLSVPMQRVLKYHLLLRELIRNTVREHPEKQGLEKALEEMQDLSLYVNEVKRDNEALQLITEIQKSIQDLEMPRNTDLKDYGRLLLDGEMRVKKHDDTTKNHKPRYVFLFDKVMLMCKSRMVDKLLWGENYSFKDALILSQYKIDESRTTSKEKGWQCSFNLVERSNANVYTIFTKSEDSLRKWIDAIRLAHENTQPPGRHDGNHDFIMASFSKPTICDICRKLLRGVFYQGYKCQKTNLVAHKECIPKAKDKVGPPTIPPPPGGINSRTPPVPPARNIYKAVLPYDGRNPLPGNGCTPLRFNVGDEILLSSSNVDTAVMWQGTLVSGGSAGYFPRGHVEIKHTPVGPPRRPSNISRHTSVPDGPPDSPRVVSDLAPPSPHTPGGRSYINMEQPNLRVYPWFVGQMSRDEAARRLEPYQNSTFLIRESTSNFRAGEYALSIKYKSNVKHIKIVRSPDHRFFLADCLVFPNIPKLVEYYQSNTLENSFPDLTTTLVLPFKDAERAQTPQERAPLSDLGTCRALYDYSANQPNQLSFKVGDVITIISKAGDNRGWWKGRLHDKVAYFPSAYVEEEEEQA